MSMRELAARLGVKPAALYNHVDGIDELAFAVSAEADRVLAEKLREAWDGESDRQRAFVDVCHAYRDFALKDREMYRMLMRIPKNCPVPVPERPMESVRVLDELISIFGLGPEDMVHISRQIRAAIHGFTSLETAGFMQKLDPPLTQSFHRMILGLLHITEKTALGAGEGADE